MQQPGDYTLVLRPVRDPLDRPIGVRLRLLLKHALRAQALQCVHIEQAPEPTTPHPICECEGHG